MTKSLKGRKHEEIKLGLDLSSFIVQAYQAQFFIVHTKDKIFAEISESLDVNCRITYKDQEAWRKRPLSLVKIKTTWDILGAKLTWRESKRTVVIRSYSWISKERRNILFLFNPKFTTSYQICESGGKVGLVVKGKRVCFGTIFSSFLCSRNGVLAKLERYHDLGPWFYRGINNSGLGGSSMMLSSVCVRPNWFLIAIATTWRGYSSRDLGLKDFEWVIPSYPSFLRIKMTRQVIAEAKNPVTSMVLERCKMTFQGKVNKTLIRTMELSSASAIAAALYWEKNH
ncbi:hypothetical protein HID58_056466, partial [Brassica napus]